MLFLLLALSLPGCRGAGPSGAALMRLEPYAGVTGSIVYRGSGDPSKSVVLVRIDGGRAAVHTVLEPEDPPRP
jgi:hypothetical protein